VRRDLFLVKDPTSLLPVRVTREKDKVTEAYYGSDWYPGTGRTAGHARSIRRKRGRVHWALPATAYGMATQELCCGKGSYSSMESSRWSYEVRKVWPGDPEAPDWIAFETVINGRAMRLNLSGVVFREHSRPMSECLSCWDRGQRQFVVFKSSPNSYLFAKNAVLELRPAAKEPGENVGPLLRDEHPNCRL
jgi:hypothetical protein